MTWGEDAIDILEDRGVCMLAWPQPGTAEVLCGVPTWTVTEVA